MATFLWNDRSKRYEIEVCGMIVSEPRTLDEVKAFSAMHNDRLAA